MKPDEKEGISKLTPEVINQVEQLYRMGLRDRTVAGYIGVHPNTLVMWLNRGREHSNTIYGQLFERAFKAVSGHEIQFIAKMNEHALGSPAKLAYKKNPDGTDSNELLLDSEGKPIILQEEIRSNPNWIAWVLERRHSIWNKTEKFDINSSTVDNPIHDALPEKDAKQHSLPVPMTKEEQIEMYARAIKRIKDNV